jgi:hypothetical protein
MKKLFQTFSVLISVSMLVVIAEARLAKADDTVAAAAAAENAAAANDASVPVNEEPAHSDAITTESSNADRSPAGWLSEPESDDEGSNADSAESGVL